MLIKYWKVINNIKLGNVVRIIKSFNNKSLLVDKSYRERLLCKSAFSKKEWHRKTLCNQGLKEEIHLIEEIGGMELD